MRRPRARFRSSPCCLPFKIRSENGALRSSTRNQLDQTSPIQLKGVHNVWHSVIKLRQRRRRRRRWRRRAGGEGSSARGRIPAAGGQLCRAHGACCFGNSSSHAAPGGATRGCICRAHILGRVRAPTPNGIGARVLTHTRGERARGWQARGASCEGDSSSHAAPGGTSRGCMSSSSAGRVFWAGCGPPRPTGSAPGC